MRNRNQGENPIYFSNKKNKVLRNTPNQGGKRPVLRKPHNTEERNYGRQINGSVYHVHGLEEITSSKCPYYPKQSTDSTKSLLKYCDIFHRYRTNISKICVEP